MKEKTTKGKERIGRKIGITAKVVVILLVVSLVTIGCMAGLNLNAFKNMGDMTKKDSKSVFGRETKEHLERIVTDKTTFCEKDLDEIKDLIYAEEAFALELYNNGTDYKYIEQTLDTQYSTHSDDPVPANAPSDYKYSEKFQRMLSLKYLAIKPAPEVNLTYDQNDNLFSPDPEVNKTLHTFSQMITLFRSASGEHSTVRWIYIGTPAGLHFCYPGHGPYGESYDCRLRGWYKRANETGEFGWSDPYVDANGLGLMITASKPVYDSDNKLIGVVAADVTIDTINNELISLDPGESGYTYLIDSEGAVISKPEYEAGDVRWDSLYPLTWRHNTTNEELNNVTKKMMNGETGSTIITLGGERKYIVYAPVKSVGWSLAAVLPEKEALREVIEIEKEIDNNMNAMINSIIVVTIVITIIVIICCIMFGGTLTKPIIKLTETAKAMSEGNLDVKTNVVYRGDEIGDLTRSFDSMSLSLRKSYETLEVKVKDRTKELGVAKAYSENIVKSMADSLIVIDPDGKIKNVNNATVDLLDYEEKALIGKQIDEIISPIGGDVEELANRGRAGGVDAALKSLGLQKLIRTGFIRNIEIEYIAKDTRKIPMSFSGSVMRSDKGNLQGIVCVAKNISERKRMDKELKESENKYRSIFENTGTATVIIEEDMTISLINTEFLNLCGYSKGEVEGKKNWSEFVVKEDMEWMKKHHKSRRIVTGLAPKNYEFRFVDRAGDIKNIYLTIDLIPGTKKSVASLLDITKRIQMEEELKLYTQKLEDELEELEKRFQIVPKEELPRRTKRRFSVEPGYIYKVEERKAMKTFDILSELVTHGHQGLAITIQSPDIVKRKYGFEKTPVFWLGKWKRCEEWVDATKLEKLGFILRAFLKDADKGVVVLDGIDYLITMYNFNKIAKLIQGLYEFNTHNRSQIIISINPDVLEKKEMAIIDRYLESIEQQSDENK